jgi:hypothetical protein
MELLPAELRLEIPKLYAQEGKKDPIVHIKILCPWAQWTWLIAEGGRGEEGEFLFFGYVIGLERSWGYFVLSEMELMRGPGGMTLIRDVEFKRQPFSQAIRGIRPD